MDVAVDVDVDLFWLEGWKVERDESGFGRGLPARRRGISVWAVSREWQTCVTVFWFFLLVVWFRGGRKKEEGKGRREERKREKDREKLCMYMGEERVRSWCFWDVIGCRAGSAFSLKTWSF